MDEELRYTEVILFKLTVRMWESQDDYIGNLSLQLSFLKNVGLSRSNLDKVKITLQAEFFDKI